VPLPEGAGGNPFLLSLRVRPIIPVRTRDGAFAGPTGQGSFSDRDNPVRLIEDNRWDEINTGEVFGNVNGALDLTDDLTLQGRFGVDWERTQERNIQQRYQTGFLGRSVNSVENADVDNFIWTFNATAEYDALIGESHSVTLLAGTETQDRYLATATIRYDGSSRFGDNNQFGLFPAFSLGWRVTEEQFMEDRLGFLSELKLRGSWGRVGNQEIEDFASLQLFEPGFSSNDVLFVSPTSTAYDLGGNDAGAIPGGFRRIQRGNNDLQWEETPEIGLGIDYGLFDEKLVGSIDYFTRETTDILIQPGFIATVGEGGSQFINGATVETSGFELQVEYRDDVGDLSYSVSANVGHSSDEITELPDDVVDSFPGNSEKTILGRSQFSHFGYVTDGLFRSQEEVDEHASQPGAAVGRLRFKDLNGDGQINSLDQKYLGDANPDYEYGVSTNLSYEGTDLNVFFQGIQGREVNVGEFKAFTDFTSFFRGENYGSRVLDAYSPKTDQNLNSDIPAPTLSDTNGELRTSSYLIEDGSYLKLREVTLGYNLPESVTETLNLNRARVYARGENLVTVETGTDEFTGPDPETTNFTFRRAGRVLLRQLEEQQRHPLRRRPPLEGRGPHRARARGRGAPHHQSDPAPREGQQGNGRRRQRRVQLRRRALSRRAKHQLDAGERPEGPSLRAAPGARDGGLALLRPRAVGHRRRNAQRLLRDRKAAARLPSGRELPGRAGRVPPDPPAADRLQ